MIFQIPEFVSNLILVVYLPELPKGFYPSSLGDSSLIAQRWDAPLGVNSSVGIHSKPSFGSVSTGAAIRGYSSTLEVANLVGHRQDAPGISPSAGVHPEPNLGTVSGGAIIRGYSSPLEVPNLVGQRWDAPVSISPSAELHPKINLGAVPAGANVKGYPFPLEDPNLVGQRQDGLLGMRSGILGAVDEKPASMRNCDGPPVAARIEHSVCRWSSNRL